MLADWLQNRIEKRATFKDTEGWFADWVRGGRRTVAGEAVGPRTAMSLPAYYAAIRNISEDIAKMPFDVMERVPGSRTRKKLREHPAWIAMNVRPNPEMSPLAFRETMGHHAMGWGNGVAEITWNRIRSRVELWPLDPQEVKFTRDENDRLLYQVGMKHGAPVFLRPEQVFHLHGLSYDGITGYSVARISRESIGLGLAQIKSAAALFGNSSRPDGLLEIPGKLNKKERAAVREGWNENYQGAERSHKTAVLDRGMKFVPISVSPKDAQWIAAQEFSVEEFCRITRCPPSKVQHLKKANFNTLEMQNQEYQTDTLLSWEIRWEQETKLKLIGIENKNVYAKHNANSILRGDIKTRYDAYKTGRNWGWESANSVLELEDRDGIGEQGDIYLIPLNMADASKLNEPKPEPAVPDVTVGTTDGESEEGDEMDAGTRAAIVDRAHEEVSQAIDAKDAISRIVWAHAPAMQDTLANMARVVGKCKEESRKTAEFRLERIDHTSRCLGTIIGPCLRTAWSIICEPAEPGTRVTLDEAAAGFAASVAERHIDGLLAGDVNISATVTAESGRLCTFLEDMICVQA